MYFDTHCHLNFKIFNHGLEKVVDSANKAGVYNIIVPGTDVESSVKAVEIAEKYKGVYAAVGIHPHHVFNYFIKNLSATQFLSHESLTSASRGPLESEKIAFASEIKELTKLLLNQKVVAVGEVGIDKHEYQKTVYQDYQVHQDFLDLQKEIFIEQIKLAHQYKKALIIHNREAKKEVLEILIDHQYFIANYHSVFHCFEPDDDLLDFAKKNNIFLGVDGDITYRKDKKEFIKKIPLNLLVLETDSPFLVPRTSLSRSLNRYNEPKNIPIIAEFIASLLHCPVEDLARQTTENAKRLFNINN